MKAGWTEVALGDAATLQRGFDLPVNQRRPGDVPIFAANGPVGRHDGSKLSGPGVVTGRSGTIGKVHFTSGPYWPLNTSLFVKDFHGNDPRFVYWLLRQLRLERFLSGTGVPTLNRNIVHRVPVLIPPIEEQQRIAAVLDAADALRAKRRQAIAKLDTVTQAIFVDMFGATARESSFPVRRLGDVVSTTSGGTPKRSTKGFYGGTIPWVKSGELHGRVIRSTEETLTEPGLAGSSAKLMPAGTVLLAMYGATVGAVATLAVEASTN